MREFSRFYSKKNVIVKRIKTIILSVNVPDMKCKLPETPMYTKTQNRLGLRGLSNAVRAAECPCVSEYWIVLSGSEERKRSALIIDDVFSARDPHPRLPGPGLRGQAELPAAGGH